MLARYSGYKYYFCRKMSTKHENDHKHKMEAYNESILQNDRSILNQHESANQDDFYISKSNLFVQYYHWDLKYLFEIRPGCFFLRALFSERRRWMISILTEVPNTFARDQYLATLVTKIILRLHSIYYLWNSFLQQIMLGILWKNISIWRLLDNSMKNNRKSMIKNISPFLLLCVVRRSYFDIIKTQ